MCFWKQFWREAEYLTAGRISGSIKDNGRWSGSASYSSKIMSNAERVNSGWNLEKEVFSIRIVGNKLLLLKQSDMGGQTEAGSLLDQIGHVHGHLLHGGVVECLNVPQCSLVILSYHVNGYSLSAETTSPTDPVKNKKVIKFTVDMWTSPDHRNVFGFTAYAHVRQSARFILQ